MKGITLALCLALASLAGATLPIERFTLSIDGIGEVPVDPGLFAFGFDRGVIEIQNGDDPVVRKRPGRTKTSPLSFFLPEVDDEVIVIYQWFQRMRSGQAEPHNADLIGYDREGTPVARWTLTKAWPSKISGPRLPSIATRHRAGHFITLQVDDLIPADPAQAAPWPEIVSLDVNRAANTFTFAWRSIEGATYDVYRYDPVRKQSVVDQTGIRGTGGLTTLSRLLEQEGIYWVVLTGNAPTP